jgi:hypothetical protein
MQNFIVAESSLVINETAAFPVLFTSSDNSFVEVLE